MVTAKQIQAIQKSKGRVRDSLMATFITENAALVDYVTLKFAAQWKLEHQIEDLKQQARLAMVKAVGSFKIKKNGINPKTGKRFSAKTWNCASYFSNWFWLVSRDELQKAARASGEMTKGAKGVKSGRGPLMLPLHGEGYSGTTSEGTAMPFGDTIALGACDNQELVTAIRELPALEQAVLSALMIGDSVVTIGKRYGLPDPAGFIASMREKLT